MKKKMFMEQLRGLEGKELVKVLNDAQQNLFSICLNVNAKTGNIKDTASLSRARKNVARVQTVINEKLKIK